MKALLLAFLLVFSLSGCDAFLEGFVRGMDSNNNSSQSTFTRKKNTQQNTSINDDSRTPYSSLSSYSTVWVSGNKYHKNSYCNSISIGSSTTAMTFKEAEDIGATPCYKCFDVSK